MTASTQSAKPSEPAPGELSRAESSQLLPAVLVVAVLFVVSFGVFGISNAMIEDDYWSAYPPNSFVGADERPCLAEVAGRVWAVTGVNRFLTHTLVNWLFPRIADCFWVLHLWILINHALNGWLVYGLVRRVSNWPVAALLAATLFVLWPLQGEVVFWASTFNYHLGMTLLLVTGRLWLWAAPDRPGWAWRALPIVPCQLLLSQFNEQALIASIAWPALTIFRPAGRADCHPHVCDDDAGVTYLEPVLEQPTNLMRDRSSLSWSTAGVTGFMVQSLFLAAPVMFWGVLYVALMDAEAMKFGNRALAQRYRITRLEELPRKVVSVLKTHSKFLPFMRYGRVQIVGTVRRLPTLVAEYPAVWGMPLLAAAVIWASIRYPLPVGGSPVSESRDRAQWDLRGLIAFSLLMWFYALVPIIASSESWASLRLGYVGGLGQAIISALLLAWMGVLAERTSERLMTAARVAMALLLIMLSVMNLVEGWQYRRQFQLDEQQAEQVRQQFRDGRPGPKYLLVADVPMHGQPLTIAHLDHIINVWAFPWVAEPFLRRQFPGHTVYYQTTGYAGTLGIRPQELLDNWECVYAFRFPFYTTADLHEEPQTNALLPVHRLEFRTATGQTLVRLRLPRMSVCRDGSCARPIDAAITLPHDHPPLRIPPELDVHRY